LIAICDSVLRVRTVLTAAVAEKLKALTPDKVEQFELLVRDHRSMRRLADQTLNNESVVTNENAEDLLEAMRQATIEDERKVFAGQLAAEKAKAKETLGANAIKTRRATEERDEARAQLGAREQDDAQNIRRIAVDVTTLMRRVEGGLTLVIAALAVAGIFNYFTGVLSEYRIRSLVIAALLAAFALYHQVMNALQRPKIGVRSLMAVLAKFVFLRRLKQAGLESKADLTEVTYEGSRVTVA
jgi:hypothetical protein